MVKVGEEDRRGSGEERKKRKSKEDRGRRELGSRGIVEEEGGTKMKAQELGGKNRKTSRAQGWKRQ